MEFRSWHAGRNWVLFTIAVVVSVLGTATWVQRDRIAFWWRFEPLGKNAQGYREYRHRATGIVLVRVPGGEFLMGSPPGEPGREEGEDQHRVILSPFLIGKYEVSQAEWVSAMKENPSFFRGDDLPVEMVSWDDVQRFVAVTGLRLPTEAQWEFACRAGTTTPFCFGDGLSREQANCERWYETPAPALQVPPTMPATISVRSLVPNGFGMHHVHGNVKEWCVDLFHEAFYSSPLASAPDPVCRTGSVNRYNPQHPLRRVVRGGSFLCTSPNCRSAARYAVEPVARGDYVGFRVAFGPLP